jgi:hypothetical protein
MSESNGHTPTGWELPSLTAHVIKGYPLLRRYELTTVAGMLRELGCQGAGTEYRERLRDGGSVGGRGADRETACAWTLRECWKGYPPVNHAALELARSGLWVPPLWARRRALG